MANMIKVMRYQIIKPVDTDWDTLGKVLREIQFETRQILNKSIQICCEYQGFSADYKEIHGQYPKAKEILSYTNLQGYAYDRLKNQYDKLYSGNLTQTIRRATDKWKSDLKEILRGDKSIPNFKKDCPIDIVSSAIKLSKESIDYYADLKLISTEYKKVINRPSTSFNILIKVGDNTQRTILDRIYEGEYKISASQILNVNKKWFLNLSYSFETQERQLDPNNIMGIDLGIAYPIYMAFNNSLNRYKIKGGEIEEFRRRVENRRNNLKEQGKYCGDGRRGHGVKTRIQPIDKISHRISNFRDTINHKYSKYAVEMALKHQCGTIQMEDLSGISAHNVFLKNWSYYDLQQKIEYKAGEKGIKVIKINPEYTSQRCHKCGHIDKENRETQAEFMCKNCGLEVNADYNAARNIATKDIEKIIQDTLNIEK